MSTEPTVLALNRSPGNLRVLEEMLRRRGIKTLRACNTDELHECLASGERIDLALIDVTGFDRTVWTSCERMRERSIPFLVISPRFAEAITREGLQHGARAVLPKPLQRAALFDLIDAAIGPRLQFNDPHMDEATFDANPATVRSS